MKEYKFEIGNFYKKLLNDGIKSEKYKTYERLNLIGKNIQIKTFGNKYVNLKYLSRHKTIKHLVEFKIIDDDNKTYSVIVTTDHVCMVYNSNHFFENVNAKNVKINDFVSVYDAKNDKEHIGVIKSIVDVGETSEYVYDCEVDDEMHSFYANDVLVHNSQFSNIQCVTDWMKKEYGYDDVIAKWTDEQKLKLWKWMDDFVENEVNGFVKDLITNYYHTEHAEVLRYSLEYIGDCGIYEAKKHYGIHKILSEGPEIVDKIKYSGIELKKATVPEKIKEILGEIYAGILTKNWTEKDFNDYILNAYDNFKLLTIDDISIWKGYNTSREADGFLKMALIKDPITGKSKGTTGIASACTFYNQLLDKLGIGKKYDQILLGQKVRFCYVLPDNEFQIPYIAYHDGQYPVEFTQIFAIDYETMFDKLILSPLKGFFEATKFKKVDPRKQVMMDIFDL